MALLSCWGEVTTENEMDVIAANRIIHPKLEELLSILTNILSLAKIEYWIDQGTLLGAYRHGKFIARDSDVDIAIKDENQFKALSKLLESKLPNGYEWERKGSHCRGYKVWLKSGGTFNGKFEGKKIQWPLVVCDVMFYQHDDEKNTFVQEYEGFGVDMLSIPEDVIFPLNQISFEGNNYPCPAQVQEYLEIQYGYIGEGAIWNPKLNRWSEG
jgi:phosphorylcholine metabolism protein LicD